MDTDIRWIHNAYARYVAMYSKKPISISDWHNEDDNIKVPWEIICTNNYKKLNFATKYQFCDSNDYNKNCIKNYLNYLSDSNILSENITITHNSTSSIYLSLKYLKHVRCKRVLIVTPSYFSIYKTIENLNFNYIYHHLLTSNNFKLELNCLKKMIDDQYIECIILTDPVFCTGIKVKDEVISDIANYSRERNIWFVLDKTLSGLDWNSEKFRLIEDYSSLLNRHDKIIIIDSPTKKLFLNGLKHSVIFSNKDVISYIESIADEVVGSFSYDQLSIIEELYNIKNFDIISNTIKYNINQFSENYDLVDALLADSNYYITRTVSGFHSIIFHRNKKVNSVNTKLVTLHFLNSLGVYVIPITHFGFHDSNNFGFRINLSKHQSKLFSGISLIVNENLDFF